MFFPEPLFIYTSVLMLSLASNYSFQSSMVNTPVISPSTLKDDPFKTMLSNVMQTPDVIDFSLSFAPMNTTSSAGSTNAIPSITTTSENLAYRQSASSSTPVSLYYEPVQPAMSQSVQHLAAPQPTFTSFPSTSESQHDAMLLDLSPRIRNQIARPPAFPHNVASAPSTFVTSTHATPVQSASSSSYQASYQAQSESSLQMNPDFAYPFAMERRQPLPRNVTSTVSRPTDSFTTSYDSSLSHNEDILSSDSNTLDYLSESNDRSHSVYQPFSHQSARSHSPIASHSQSPIASSSSIRDDLNEERPFDRYLSLRSRNNSASKKFRSSKRDQQKEMERQIKFYLEDNQKCHKLIAKLEKEIEQCKSILFKNFRKN